MTDLSKKNHVSMPAVREISCADCGRIFIFRGYERKLFERRGWVATRRCPACRKAAKDLQRKEMERQERQKWQQKKAEEKEIFDARLKHWKVIKKDEIRPKNDNVLYIIGNGFDLMHNVSSSYYGFRDSLGKENALRQALENFLTPEDIWADFEDALAHFNIEAMGSSFMVDNWLHMFEAYGNEAGAAEISMAVEGAANPIITVAEELPHRFRMWVEKLTIGTKDRPLRNMFRNGKVLCFNYTEFVETLYEVFEENVCYIHGCRRKKKHCPKETLILGHLPGASEEAYDFADDSFAGTKNPYQNALIDVVQEQVFHLISAYDEELTKDCREIITAHNAFFSKLQEIEEIIVIGHSFAPVDWDYFLEVAARLPDRKAVHWYFGCYGLRDLDNLEQLLTMLGLSQSDVSVFPTDDIVVTPLKDKENPALQKSGWVEKIRCASSDGRWSVKTVGNSLLISNEEKQETDYEVMLSSPVNDVFFAPSEEILFLVIRGIDAGVLFFRCQNNHWGFVNELESIQNQNLVNPRLKQVFLTAAEIVFVYNNRVRKYSLEDGRLVSNLAKKGAGTLSYDGDKISHLFLKGK